MARSPAASIILPLRNGGPTSIDTIKAVLGQQLEGGFEVIVIDSESSDGSPEGIQRIFADPQSNPFGIALHLVRIAVRDFGHGKTRNYGARLAVGEVVVFLSQDATPTSATWLSTLLMPFRDPAVVGAYCRQIPRSQASLPEQFILRKTYPVRSALRTASSVARRDAGYILFSNAASAVRKSVLVEHPFDEHLMMCEDAEWAVRMLSAGASIAYVADAIVEHSHGYSLRSIFSRNFDYAVSLRGLPGSMGVSSYLRYLREELSFVTAHGGRREWPGLAGFEAARCMGYVLGAHADRLPARLSTKLTAYPQWFRSRRFNAVLPSGSARASGDLDG
jgi:rhamnosyltransferase